MRLAVVPPLMVLADLWATTVRLQPQSVGSAMPVVVVLVEFRQDQPRVVVVVMGRLAVRLPRGRRSVEDVNPHQSWLAHPAKVVRVDGGVRSVRLPLRLMRPGGVVVVEDRPPMPQVVPAQLADVPSGLAAAGVEGVVV